MSRLAHLLKLRTVSDAQAEGHVRQPEEFSRAHKHLEASYSDVWKHMAVETVKSIASTEADRSLHLFLGSIAVGNSLCSLAGCTAQSTAQVEWPEYLT